MKGFQRLIPMMKYLPEVDLRIAGTGPYEPELRALAAGLPNVRFEGLLGGDGARPAVPRGEGGRRAVAVPRDVRLRRAGGVRGADAGRRPPRRGGDRRDGRRERRGPRAMRPTPSCCRPAAGRPRRPLCGTSWRRPGYAMRHGRGRSRRTSTVLRPDPALPRGKPSAARRTPAPRQGDGPPRVEPGPSTEADGRRRSPAPMRCAPAKGAGTRADPAGARRSSAFTRLVASPGSLIVDGRRPSVDHAHRGHGRRLGNDLTAVFLPRFVYVVGRARADGQLPALGHRGVRRPAARRQPAGRAVLPAGLARLVVGTPGVARLADGRPPALGRGRRLRADAVAGVRAVRGGRRGGVLPGVART